MDYESQLIEILKKKRKKPLSVAQLAEKLGIDDRELFKQFLDELEEQGIIVPAGKKGYAFPDQVHRYTGTFIQIYPRGAAVRGSHKGHDFEILVPSDHTAGAKPGNRVLVEITGRRGKSRKGRHLLETRGLSGKIIKVYGVQDAVSVGIVVRGRHHRLYVLARGASGKRSLRLSRGSRRLEAGTVVRFRLLERAGREDAAEVIEIIGDVTDPAADSDIVALSFGIPVDIPDDALREARKIPASAVLEEAPNRTDLTGETCVTIDPEDAKDFDDAVSCRRTAKGWEVGVHIADVSFFTPRGSTLDRAALERGTSVYLPGRVIPMLPERLANDLCSLRPNEPRLAKSVHMTVEKNGNVRDIKIARTLIKSARRFTYEEVGAILRRKKDERPELVKLLRAMQACAKALRKRRISKGTLILDIPKPDITLNPDGTLVSVERETQDEPHWIIEEFMLAANEAVASYFIERGVPYISRIHPEPSAELLEALGEFLRDLGHDVGARPSPFDLQKVLAATSGKKGAGAIHLAILKSMQRAEYSPRRSVHHALATDKYLHFTSPIRRYPDLHVHQTLDALLGGGYNRKYEETTRLTLHAIAGLSTAMERRAEKAEREVVELKILRHLEDKIGLKCGATVSGVMEFGVFCTLDDYLIDGMISMRDMEPTEVRHNRYRLTAYTSRGKMEFAVGDPLKVTIERIDLARRELDLIPVVRGRGSASTRSTRTAVKKSGKKKKKPAGRKDRGRRKREPKRKGRRKR